MTQLIPKSERDSLGIDTLPRAIIYAILILESVTQSEALQDKIKFIPSVEKNSETITANFVGEVTLSYNPVESAKDGFRLWENINELTTLPSPEFVISNPSTPTPTNPLPTEPAEINTLEKYLYWCCSILAASVSPNLDYCKINFSNTEPSIILEINLPFNYSKSLLGANQLESSINFVTAYITDLGSINSDWTIPPSAQYWGDPVASIAELKALVKTIGTTLWVSEKLALYTLIDALPDGETADDDLYAIPDDQVDSEVWKKGGTGQGTGTGTGTPGADGKNPEFQFSATHLQYRLMGETNWINLIPKADLIGPQGIQGATGAQGIQGTNGSNIELQKTATHIQWRIVGGTWADLVPLLDLKGDAGTVSATNGLLLTPIATPDAPTSGVILYIKEDLKLYMRAAGGNEELVGSSSTPSPNTDPYASNIVLYLDGASLTDLSPNPKVIQGGIVLDSAIKKSGTSSYKLTGTNAITIESSNDFNLGGSNFTIEFWYYPIAKTQFSAILSRDGEDYPYCIYHNTDTQYTPLQKQSNLQANFGSNTAWNLSETVSVGVISNNTWVHIAFVRNGNNYTGFLNGIPISTLTGIGDVSVGNTGSLTIGANGTSFITANIQNIRITKVARYTSIFNPETDTFF